ncbi:FliM/FliN family flagellar motor switch protein [Enterobacteriaceae bacterium H20N1]|uniref:FliM/FliN family flagellar motor switch protein n=1 Tax=Dryocola boscaweniae TaxID=2925397 RepID=A0A9X2W5T4_9ENTR|nr:FliM/FliN family flagellar motor switch protein [Dryocola boscaweniae]MCT4700528.1 FliM/FliN family flagellar motor switch protein [Dryocola boscaweniae]MCT4717684.1 FliM/FliN family flagellar motor switch protein [Dryocola boscaweniae]
MKQDMYDAAWRELSLHIGAGLLAPEEDMALTLEHHNDADIRWREKGSDNREIWCRQQTLCDWLSPLFPVNEFADYPVDSYPLLTELCLEKGNLFLARAAFSAGSLASGLLPSGWRITLTLRNGERRLALMLAGWSWQQICQLTTGWLPFASATGSLPLSLPLSLGYCELTLSALLALKTGDGIVLSTADIAAGGLWLWFGRKRVTMIQNEHADLQVTEVMEAMPAMSCGELVSDRMMVPLTLVAEVGQIALSVAELVALAPGAVLEGKASLAGGIRLTANGCCIGYGSLLTMRDKWIVRVDTLINTRIAPPEMSRSGENSQAGSLHNEDEEQYGLAG